MNSVPSDADLGLTRERLADQPITKEKLGHIEVHKIAIVPDAKPVRIKYADRPPSKREAARRGRRPAHRPGRVMNLPAHPATTLFPMMPDAELRELAEDIRQYGQQIPIILYKGQVLDGRNRYEACKRADTMPRTVEWDGQGGDPVAFVLSMNLRRRQLAPSQIAAVTAEAEAMFIEQARERENRGAPVREGERGRAIEKAAGLTGGKVRYAQEAKAIKEAAPEVFERVKAGELSIPEAKRFVMPEMEEETEEEKAFHLLSRFRLMASLDPALVAEASRAPENDAASFTGYLVWLAAVVQALRDRAKQPVRAVK